MKFYKKWWFWAIVTVLLGAGWYWQGYFVWLAEQWQIRSENRAAYQGWVKMQEDQAALEAAYRADTYGGDTPEETLQLFIEALEAKDYELASKYFVVEKRDEVEKDLQELGRKGNDSVYLDILQGDRKGSLYKNQEEYEIEFYDSSGAQIHIEFFRKNPFTGKWKISE